MFLVEWVYVCICVHACMHVKVYMNICVQMCEGQKTTAHVFPEDIILLLPVE